MRLELIDLSLVINRFRPRLKRDFVQHILRQRGGSAIPAAGLLSWNRTNPGFAVGSSRSGRCGRCWLTASTSASTASSSAASSTLALLTALFLLCLTGGSRRLAITGGQ